MTEKKLPRKSAANTQHALRVLAVGKYLTNLIRQAETQAKDYLFTKELAVKDRRTVTLEDGSDIGTVSMVQGRKGSPKIVDPIAFATWCDDNGIHHGGTPSVVFPEWFTAKANLEGLLARFEGEVPDGLELPADGRPYVMCRQSAAQAMTLRDSINNTSARDLLADVAPLQIEGETK